MAARQLEMLFETNPRGLVSIFLYSCLLVAALWQVVPRSHLLGWLASMTLVVVVRYLLYRRYRQCPPASVREVRSGTRLFLSGAAATGLMWGVSTILLFPRDAPAYQLILGMVVIGMTTTAVAYLSAVARIYITYMALALLPFSLFLLTQPMPYPLLTAFSIPFMAYLILTSVALERDIRSSLRLAFEKQMLAIDLEQARDRAEDASAAKSEFLSKMSHELRTPMNAIMGFTELLGLDISDPEQRSYLEQIRSSSEHLLAMINDLLDLTRIESGQLELDIGEHSLSQVVEDAVRMVRPMAEARQIRIDNGVNEAPDLRVMVDPVRFRQVVLNLLSNAVKYNRNEGRILLRQRREGNRVELAVTDTGVGIEPDRIDQLFRPFERGEWRNSGVEGVGIGLVISRNLIRQMDGDIRVDSVPGEGSTFTVSIPDAAASGAV